MLYWNVFNIKNKSYFLLRNNNIWVLHSSFRTKLDANALLCYSSDRPVLYEQHSTDLKDLVFLRLVDFSCQTTVRDGIVDDGFVWLGTGLLEKFRTYNKRKEECFIKRAKSIQLVKRRHMCKLTSVFSHGCDGRGSRAIIPVSFCSSTVSSTSWKWLHRVTPVQKDFISTTACKSTTWTHKFGRDSPLWTGPSGVDTVRFICCSRGQRQTGAWLGIAQVVSCESKYNRRLQ